MAISTAAPMTEGRRIVIAFIVACAFLMQGIDSTLLTVAIPSVARGLGVEPLLIHLAITAYLLSLAVFMPVSGWFADRLGARKVFCGSLMLFTLGSICAGLAPNLELLVAARVLQGFGGALMTPVGRLIVLRTFGPGRTLDAMTYLTLPVLLGPLLGPVLGAVIVSFGSWRWIFFVNVPVCAATIALALIYVKRDIPVGGGSNFDFRGFAIAGLAVVLFQLGIEHLGHPIAGLAGTLALFAGSATVGYLYVQHARRTLNPALDIALFSTRAFSVGVIAGGIGRIGLNASAFLLPLLLQIGFGMHPLHAALYSSLAAIGALGGKPLMRRSIKRLGFSTTLIALVVVGSAMMAGFSLMNANVSLILLVPYVVVLGAIRTMHFNSVNTLTYSDVPEPRLSAAVSSAGVFQQLSMGLGISISAAVLSLVVADGATIQISDFATAFVVMAGIPILSIPILLTLRNDDGQGLPAPQLGAVNKPA